MKSVGQDAEPPNPDEAGGIWMTKAEIAAVRRISVLSADRLIRRQGWRKERGNDGRARVLVPPTWAEPRYGNPTDGKPDPTDTTRTNPTYDLRTINDLEKAVETLEQQLSTVRADKDRLRADWERQLTAARTELTEIRAELQAARADAVEQRSRADRAEGVVEGLKARPSAVVAWLRSMRHAFRP